ncbi:hypothetical protein [Paenibacillus shenyangensis]|uniref:hypothetical protein n=1 Tax=Paenibacillus sp. A9 TaxID=1284352 RepID=UPI0003729975|nr:hypothetical protein [Paenibacillus sp. A9]
MKLKISMIALFTVVMLTACGQEKQAATTQPAASTETAATTTESTTTTTEAEEQPAVEQAAETAPVTAPEQNTFADAMVNLVPYMTENQGEMSQQTYDYITAHPNQFPATTTADKQEVKNAVDSSVTSRHMFKNVAPYLDKMVTVSGNVVEVSEEETEMGTVAFVHLTDEYDNSVTGVYLGSTGDLLDGDDVTVRGVPVTTYSFENVGGGTTNAVMLALSTVQKEK